MPVWLVLAALAIGGILYGLAAKAWKLSIVFGSVIAGAILCRYWLIELKLLNEPMAAVVIGAVIFGVVAMALSRWVLGFALGLALAILGVLVVLATHPGKPVMVPLEHAETWLDYVKLWRKAAPDALVMTAGMAALAGWVAAGLLVRFAERHAIAFFWPLAGVLISAGAGVIWSAQTKQAWLTGPLGTRGDVAGVLLGLAVLIGYAIALKPSAKPVAQVPPPAAAPARAA